MSQVQLKLPKGPAITVALLLLGLCLSILTFHTFQLHDDHVQILLKAHKYISTGEWSHFGNRGTGVGYIPGSIMTAITAIPMSLNPSPYSAFTIILLFHGLSLWLMWKAGKTFLPNEAFFLLLIFFWLNPWRVQQSELYNPAYLFLFSTVHLWTSLQMKEKDFWATILHILSIGLCVQFHFSAIILGFTSLILFGTRFIRVHWVGFTLATSVTLASLIPWALAYLNTPQIQISVANPNKAILGTNFVLIYPVLKAISYWVRYGSTYFARHNFTSIEFAWVQWEFLRETIYIVFHFLKWIFAAFTMYYSLTWNWRWLKRTWKERPFRRSERNHTPLDRFRFYFFYLFCGMILAAGLSPVEFNHWHLILCFPAVILMLSWMVSVKIRRMTWQRFKLKFLAMVGFCCALSIFAAFGGKHHSLEANFHQSVLEFFEFKRNNQQKKETLH